MEGHSLTREHKRLGLIGFPFDEKSSYMRGPSEGPPLIRKALYSDSANLWSESGIDLGSESLVVDAGDIDASGGAFQSQIQEAISNLLSRGLIPVALGGDHSITYPIVKAFHEPYPNLDVLVFDAHPDIYDEFQGDRYSHACPFARIMEDGLAGSLVQVGVRTMTAHHREQIRRYGVKLIEMKDLDKFPTLRFESPLYVSVDMDVLDPAFAPGVSHHEPGGLSTRELIALIHSLQAEIVGADLVEYNPRRDPQGITAMTCAKVVKELAAKILDKNAGAG